MITTGIHGFYLGWFPALVQKIPSYALTWMLFQQFKQVFYTSYCDFFSSSFSVISLKVYGWNSWMLFTQWIQAFLKWNERSGTTFENTLLGSLAAAGACCIMIPVDTVKTRIVTQRPGSVKHYDGMVDCFTKVGVDRYCRCAVLLCILILYTKYWMRR